MTSTYTFAPGKTASRVYALGPDGAVYVYARSFLNSKQASACALRFTHMQSRLGDKFSLFGKCWTCVRAAKPKARRARSKQRAA